VSSIKPVSGRQSKYWGPFAAELQVATLPLHGHRHDSLITPT
jgi:hypothetical protein